MAHFDEKTLRQHIKSAEYLPVYLFYGDEDYLKKNFVDLLVSKCVNPAFESLNFSRYEGKNILFTDILEQASVMPMMSDKRCIVVEDYKLENMNDSEISEFENYLSSSCDTAIIIFLQSSAEYKPKKSVVAIGLIEKHGGICALNKRKGNDLIKPLVSAANKFDCVLTTQMANYLVSVVGDDFNVLINELQKICSFAHGGEITRHHIDEIATKSDEVQMYYLTKALLQKDFDKAYKVLHILLKQKVEPNYILGILIGTYVDMYRAKISLYCGEKAEALAEDYGYKIPAYRLINAGKDSSRIEISTLRKCLDVLFESDMKLKSGSDSQALILEQLMVKLFLIANGEKV